MEQDIPDYDMDSDDERWLNSQTQKLDLSPLKFEEMMDRLEKNSGQTGVTLNEAKALLKEDDYLIIAVFEYWLNKRLKTVNNIFKSIVFKLILRLNYKLTTTTRVMFVAVCSIFSKIANWFGLSA